ncbi:transcriptional repressor DicA [Rhodobacteraceae bacterium THAF1]|uniref:helix-turn-helix domain-containing protein n=1 Tax=Palleronia sp. THAF1 TaxID=2587842 RepID=UPI000F3C894E|nr:helix-turn-helix transcriptional regulator [Palleronia sp. THAF1]QFU09416.1 transcriptional repressor DicA [Palleronia sp. THAF1]VDC21954.1 transcriptional repressor DicA [Rhodobacteraceae bacterium THAF1]
MSDISADDWYSEETATFGDRLAAAREAAKMTQKDLAQKLGVKLTTIEAWENDKAEPRANRLSIMAGILNVTLRWLLTGEGDDLPTPSDDELPEGVGDILRDMRKLSGEIHRASERLAVLEKRLRQAAV